MGTTAAKALLFLLLAALPAILYAQSPYSDAAGKTFITLYVDGSEVSARVSFLNITYFSQTDAKALEERYEKAKASKDLGELYKIGSYSSDGFTASVDPARGVKVSFAFEGNPVTDGSGNEICNPVLTDEKGMASCRIEHYKDPASGQTRNLEDYKSCGYATVSAAEMELEGGTRLTAASESVVVCPEKNSALSAFGPAIATELGSNMPFCFPAMLIVGLLIASMYYSGRDPLSLFDITTPKLPKTPTFKVKMGTAPQMLRQVQRRYAMIKKQARRDSVREIGRMAARSSGGDRQVVADAKRRMNGFYDDLEAAMKKGLNENDEMLLRQRWSGIMEAYSGRQSPRSLDRSLNFSSGLLNAYLKAQSALDAMGAARGRTSKGWWGRNVTDKAVSKLTDASIAFEGSKVGKVLGRIPLVKQVVSAPGKALDVAVQLRGSRASLKAIRGEMIGQVATMLGQTKAGGQIYNGMKKLHVTESGKRTWFSKAYEKVTGRTFARFEEKHDLAKKRLVDYYNVVNSLRQLSVDAHNRMFDEIASRLIEGMPLRMNAVRQLAEKMKGLSEEEISAVIRANSLDALFDKIKGGLEKTEAGKKISKELAGILGRDFCSLSESELKRISKALETLGRTGGGLSGTERENVKALARQLALAMEYERKVAWLVGTNMDQADTLRALANMDQADTLRALAKLAMEYERKVAWLVGTKDALYYESVISEFGKAEKALRENLLAYLDNAQGSKSRGYYALIERDQLKSDLAQGMTLDQLRKKYGTENINRLFAGQDVAIYRGAIDNENRARTAASGSELREALGSMMNAAGLTAENRAALQSLLNKYGDKGALGNRDRRAIADALGRINLLKAMEERLFRKFGEEEAKMKTWVLQGNAEKHLGRYAGMLPGGSFDKNPLEPAIQSALKDALGKCGWTDAQINAFMLDEKGNQRFKDMDSLEQVFKRKSAGEEYAKLVQALGNRNPEDVLRAVMPAVLDHAREWAARQYATAEIMHGGAKAGAYMASLRSALRDIETSSTVRSQIAYLGGEKPLYRQELGYAEMRVDTEALVYTARLWEKLFGVIVADKWRGTSRGEQALHMFGAAREDYKSTLERYKALYLNLVNEKSVFYDKNFAEKWAGKPFEAGAYEALLARGYTWQDKKNGLELLLSVDRKSTPMLEYDKRYMGGKDVIVRTSEHNGGRADIRDYAALVARTMGSYYSTREVGFIILRKIGDKWVYGDPFKAGEPDKMAGMGSVGLAHRKAELQVTERKRLMEEMAAKGEIKVISVKDFVTYAKDRNYGDVFGKTSGIDRLRERLRASTLYRPSMAFAELAYGAYADRLARMDGWYAGQYQLRQALDRLDHTMKDRVIDERGTKGWLGGSDRFKYSADYLDSAYKAGSWERHGGMSEGAKDALSEEMKKLSKGEDGNASDLRAAWYYNWKRWIASGIVGEIGQAETDYHNAKLEIRALERLMEGHKKNSAEYKEYAALYQEALQHKGDMLKEYRQAKDGYSGFNRDVIGWTGSHGIFVYQPHRTMWNLGLAGRLLDTRYVQGTKDAFYQISDSSVMRDPRVAIGATSPGWEYSFYVGYHTGQNVYDRARFWATNSLWEQQVRFKTDLAFTVHKWWNDRMSFFSRFTSGYPAPVESDMMYAPHHKDRRWGSYIRGLVFTVPFQSRTYSDYFRARLQDAISFTGLGAAAAAYQSLGGAGRGDAGRGWFRNLLDRGGAESSHYAGGTPYRLASLQRYADQVGAFDDFVNSDAAKNIEVKLKDGKTMGLDVARDRLLDATTRMDFEAEAKYSEAISNSLGRYVKLNDRRGRYVRDVFSGSDIQEDGSRNRFLDMYCMFHSNVFQPTIPGMLQASPIGSGEWHTFPQVAREVERAAPGSRLYPTKHYWEASYDKEAGRITFADRFSTREDAVAEAYKNDMPVLMHLMRMQQRDIHYSPLNAPSLIYASPIWLGIGRFAYKKIVYNARGFESLQSTVDNPHWPLEGTIEKFRHGGFSKYEDRYGYRRKIYGGWLERWAGGLVDEGQMTGEYLSTFRKVVDWLLFLRYEASPGSRRISRRVHPDYYGTLAKR